MRGIALDPHEKAVLDEENEAREVDPFFELEHGIDQVFIALKGGAITPEKAELLVKTMLEQQRKLYSLTRQEKHFAEKARKLGGE